MVWRKQDVFQQEQGTRQAQHQELQLLEQGEQNRVGSSALRDLYSMVCVAPGQLSSQSVRFLTPWLLVLVVPALG